jgi:glycosyltransferase involved in cell wall biosynthesis/SAM-dependent methyltransferase
LVACIRARRRWLREQKAILSSGLFDADWYLAQNPDVRTAGINPLLHYTAHGAAEGRDPNPLFKGDWYLAQNPDVRAANINPLLHYIRHGIAEGRDASPLSGRPHSARQLVPAFDLAKVGDADIILRKQRGVGLAGLSLLYVSGEPDTPGHIYRIERYIEAAAANDVKVEWVRHEELDERIGELAKFNMLVIWRVPWNSSIAHAIATVRANGGKVIFDVDDLMTEPDLAQIKVIDGIRTQFLTESEVKESYSRIRQTMLAADMCFTTTQELAFHLRRADKTTFVLPNGFDQQAWDFSRRSLRDWRRNRDGLVRLGYAGGSRTHQRDFGLCVEAIVRLLKDRPQCRLVLFRKTAECAPLLDVEEFPELLKLSHQIEWRPEQPLRNLPQEMVRFDINLAPLEFGNPYCEAKSELKFFEAALVEVPTVASPTGPFRRAIDHRKTGYLAATANDWFIYLNALVDDPTLRASIGRAAYHSALAKFGPRHRALQFGRMAEQLDGGTRAARGFALDAALAGRRYSAPKVYPYNVVFEQDRGVGAEIAVIIPLYNYANFAVEAFESVRNQTVSALDLIIVDDFSTDNSLDVAVRWAKVNARRFNRIAVLQNRTNYGLGLSRNSGFDAADTPYVLPLDADNRLLVNCCKSLLATIKSSGAAYVYPTIQQFGASTGQISKFPYDPQRFVGGNFIDAMALVSKETWAIVGGYERGRPQGWQDYDFWCRTAEAGLAGEWRPEVLAEYRVHAKSMLRQETTVGDNYHRLMADFEQRHAWVSLVDRQTSRRYPKAEPSLVPEKTRARLDEILPVLRCPVTKQKLAYNERRDLLISTDGVQEWPIAAGAPVLSRDLLRPEIKPKEHLSNQVPDEALDIFRTTSGLILNLGAGGTRQKFDHVIEVEFAVFRHTDVIADAHDLPFDDECFEAVVVMNAFEHFRQPHLVAAEILRVLKPQGLLHIHTAFLQPLHEKPYHFFNCTRYGLMEWLKDFQTEKLGVSENFCPSHSITWLASESEAALRKDVSPAAADEFADSSVRALIQLWRNSSMRDAPLWTNFTKLPQDSQEITAAGFEFVGRKPPRLPDHLHQTGTKVPLTSRG